MSALSLSIDEFTSPIDVVASPQMRITEIGKQMKEHEVRHVPVVINNIPVGIISDRDLKLAFYFNSDHELRAEDIMIPDPYCITSNTSIEEVAYAMSTRKIGSALIVNNLGELEGIFTSTDGLNALIEIVRGDFDNFQASSA